MLLGLTNKAQAERRVALVIGNSAYLHAAALPNTLNDAADIAASLERLRFDVHVHRNLTVNAMRRALQRFGRRARGADMALIYFAGHGIEVGKRNYLIPTDAQLRSNFDVDFEAVPLDLVMRAVGSAKGLRMVLLDACRNNPFTSTMTIASRSRAVGRGFSRVEPAAGTLVGYAAREGTTADDGDGRNSPYARALLAHLEQPGLEVNLLFRKVRDYVLKATNGAQEPFVYGSLPGNRIYLKAPEAKRPAVSAAELEKQRARGAWAFVKRSRNLALLRDYVVEFPDGQFRGKAEVMIGELEAEARAKHLASEKLKLETEERRRREAEARRRARAEADRQRRADIKRLSDEIAAEARRKVAEAKAKADEEARRKAKAVADERARQQAKAAADRRAKAEAAARRKAELAAELADWQTVRSSTDPAALEAYLARRPGGTFNDLAKARLDALKQQIKLAALQPRPEPAPAEAAPDPTNNAGPAPDPANSAEEALDAGQLALAIQKQLNRLGCNAGRPDGKWGRGSRRALQAFARHGKVKLASLKPAPDTLDTLAKRKSRVCPLTCGPRQEAKGDRCVTKTCGRGKELNRKGLCIAKLDDQAKKKKLNCSPRHRVRGNRCVLKSCGRGKELDRRGRCVAKRKEREKPTKKAKLPNARPSSKKFNQVCGSCYSGFGPSKRRCASSVAILKKKCIGRLHSFSYH